MLSSMRDYTNNLQFSEKFYYGNYEFYNDYENIERDYKDDLSKVYYRCKRKSKAKIIAYKNTIHHNRLLYGEKPNEEMIDTDSLRPNYTQMTMEDILQPFLRILVENNYKACRPIRDKLQQGVQLIYYPEIQQKSIQFRNNQTFFIKFLEKIQEQNKLLIKFIEQSSQNSDIFLDGQYARSWLDFEIYLSYILQCTYIDSCSSQNQNDHFGNILGFSHDFSCTLVDILQAKTWNSLILAPPNSPKLSKLVHPLVFGINQFFQHIKTKQAKNLNDPIQPKIVFLNIDGIESPSNIRAIRSMSKIKYISFYDQVSAYEKQKNSIETDEEQFKNVAEHYSEMIVKEITRKQKIKSQDEGQDEDYDQDNMFVFPINSDFLRKQYYRKLMEKNKKVKMFPTIRSSQDIMFVFEQFLYEQIRNFNPTIIIVSYNGVIDFKQTHFKDLMRNLSIISDHRIILFTNLSHLFHTNPNSSNRYEQIPERFEIYDQFLQKYKAYQFESVKSWIGNGQIKPLKINGQKFYQNISMFLKISSGNYNMQETSSELDLKRYKLGGRYSYMQMLVENQFSNIEKYLPKKLSIDHLDNLYSKQSKWEIKQNKKLNDSYERMIDQVINQLLKMEKPNSNEESKIFYRMKEIQSEIREQLQGDNVQEKEIINNYFECEKQKLLLQNLETYKVKKVYHLRQFNDNGVPIVISYKFNMLKNNSLEEISFEKYTQVIFNDKNKVVIINYKGDNEKHHILVGEIKNMQNNEVVMMNQVTQAIRKQQKKMEQQLESHKIQDMGQQNCLKQHIIYINYAHIFFNQYLYLFWPQMFDIVDQTRHMLLNLQYEYSPINKFIRINIQADPTKSQFEELQLKPNINGFQVPPRYGCTLWTENGSTFYIFGGINDNLVDYTTTNSGISIAQVQFVKGTGWVSITNLGKQYKDRKNKNQVYREGQYRQVQLKPKINYEVNQTATGTKQLIISGGFGRETTSFYNFFSYEIYIFNYEDKKIVKMEKDRRLVKLNQPIQINSVIGKLPISKQENIDEFQQKYSNSFKDKFIFEASYQRFNSNGQTLKETRQINTFIQSNYRFTEFKTDLKKIYLFGFNRNVKQKIYTKLWSPQLYILDGSRTWIVNITLKMGKKQQFSNQIHQLIPTQNNLLCLSLEQDRLYALAICSIGELEKNDSQKIILYRGQLSNINQILRKKQIPMSEAHKFDIGENKKYLMSKSMFAIEEKIYIFGGLAKKPFELRQDYILQQKGKEKYKLKIRKVESIDNSLQLQYPFIIKHKISDMAINLLYCLAEEQSIHQGMSQELPTSLKKWKIKIQTFTEQQAGEQNILTSYLNLYCRVPNTAQPIRIIPEFKEPKFIAIVKFQRFNLQSFKQIIQRIIFRANTKDLLIEEVKTLKVMIGIDNQQMLRERSNECYHFFIGLIEKIAPKIENQNKQSNYQDEALVNDLKKSKEMVNKLTLQNILGKQTNFEQDQYLFVIEDKKISRKVKYMAIGTLGNCQLYFFKIRFKHQLFICLNQNNHHTLFYHPTQLDFQDITPDNRFKIDPQTNPKVQQKISKLKISIKNFTI